MRRLSIPKRIIIFITLLLALAIVTPVLADYLGPNRVVTTTVSSCKVILYECRYVPSKKIWRYKPADSWSCSNESKPWKAYPSDPSGDCNKDNHPTYWSESETAETITTTMPEATITGAVNNCTLQNGWCNGATAPQLDLAANEPVAGYNILLIEGTLNGTSFACPVSAASCTLPFIEGDNNYSFWALSSWGDSSRMGGMTTRVDTVSPNVGMDISGVSGTNGWFVSDTTVTANGSDATSGIASTLLSIDNTNWQPSLTLSEGTYNVVAVAEDNAGNSTTSKNTPVGVDTTTPSINMAIAGTVGHNSWYKTTAEISATPSDATSGIASFEVAVDGGGYQAYNPTGFRDGVHTIQFLAIDNAGNRTETDVQSFAVDTTPPTVDLPGSWALGRNVPYSVADEGSGLAGIRVVIEDEDERYEKVTWDASVSGKHYSEDINWDGKFRDGTVAPPGTYYVWIKARDHAGNERFQRGKVVVPETNILLSMLPTEAPLEVEPSPPAELLEAEPAATAAPAVGFGGTTSQTGQAPTTQSVILAIGSAGAASTTTTAGVLWGEAAAATIAAVTIYVLAIAEKRKEDEAAQAAEVQAEIAADKERWAERGMTKEEKQEAKAQQADAHDQKVEDRQEREEWANLSVEEKAQLKWEQERDDAYAQELWKNWQEEQQKLQEEQHNSETLVDTASPSLADGGLDGNPFTSDEGTLLQNAAEKELAESNQSGTVNGGTVVPGIGTVSGTSGGTVGNKPGSTSTTTAPAETPSLWSWFQGNVIDPLKDKAEPVLTTINNGIDWLKEEAAPVVTTVNNGIDWLKEEAAPVVTTVNNGIDWLKEEAAPVVTTVNNGIDWLKGQAAPVVNNFNNWVNQNVYQPYVVPVLENANDFVQDKIIQPLENSPFVQKVVVPLSLAGLILSNPLTAIQYYQLNPPPANMYDAANANFLSEWEQLMALHPKTEENSDPLYLFEHPYEAVGIGYDTGKALLNAFAGYMDATWQQSPASTALSGALEYVGDSLCEGLGNGWDRRCGAVFYFGASVVENPTDTVVAIGTKLIGDPVAGLFKTGAFIVENYNDAELISDITQSVEEHGLWEGLKEYGLEQWDLITDTVKSDPQMQSFLVLAGFLALASIPVVGTALAAGLGAILVGKQSIELLTQMDKQLQSADSYEDAMEYASSKEVRRNLAVTLTMIALVSFGMFKGIKEINDFRVFQDGLSPSAQTSYYDMPLWDRIQVYDAAKNLGLTPSQMDYYLTEVTRPGSPLAGLPLTEALAISKLATQTGEGAFLIDYVTRYGYTDALKAVTSDPSFSLSPSELEFYLNEAGRPGAPMAGLPYTDALQLTKLATQTGRGTFLMDFVDRYGYTNALKLASPEVIKGMTNDQFLVQAQDILSQDAGYNITPENVFTTYPGSTIGKNVTFITNEAAIRNIIGDFHGMKTIYITADQAVALENALGLEPLSILNGFKITKVGNLGSLNLSYPLGGNSQFLGPGAGLPGGGTEIIINPPVPMDSLNVIDQITIKVIP